MKDTRPNGRVRQITSRGKVAPMCSCARRGSTNSVRREAKFASPIKAITPVQSRREKYFYFSFSEIMISLRHPASMRGALRDRHETLGAGCGGRIGLQHGSFHADERSDAHGEVVWSWHPGAGVKSAASDERADDGGNQAGPRGDHV